MSELQAQSGKIDQTLKDVLERLVDAYRPQRIYLFGSRATDTARSDSDYDLLLVVDDDAPKSSRSAGKAYKAMSGITVPVDILVWTKTEFEKRLHIANSLPARVSREGKLLHVA